MACEYCENNIMIPNSGTITYAGESSIEESTFQVIGHLGELRFYDKSQQVAIMDIEYCPKCGEKLVGDAS